MVVVVSGERVDAAARGRDLDQSQVRGAAYALVSALSVGKWPGGRVLPGQFEDLFVFGLGSVFSLRSGKFIVNQNKEFQKYMQT